MTIIIIIISGEIIKIIKDGTIHGEHSCNKDCRKSVCKISGCNIMFLVAQRGFYKVGSSSVRECVVIKMLKSTAKPNTM
jgi:hypothetical protein